VIAALDDVQDPRADPGTPLLLGQAGDPLRLAGGQLGLDRADREGLDRGRHVQHLVDRQAGQIEAGQRLLDPAQGVRADRRPTVEDRDRPGMAQQRLPHRPARAAQHRPPVARVVAVVDQLADDQVGHQVEQLVAGGDVAVQGHRARAEPGRDLAHGHRAEPLGVGDRHAGLGDGGMGEPARAALPGPLHPGEDDLAGLLVGHRLPPLAAALAYSVLASILRWRYGVRTTSTAYAIERGGAMGTTAPGAAIIAAGLAKRYGGTHALQGFDLVVPAGSIYGLLGPNGAGKTTAVRVFATLTRPDEGVATVAGIDVTADPAAVRRRIGLAGQHAAVDDKLTGRENLRMFGRLYHLGERRARTRADELLERFGLGHAADRLVKTYSGGMRRRLDLAASLLIDPAVLFLDEPTTGLDPRSRSEVWDSVRALAALGTTVLLTTQYLDEADQLADAIAVIDSGRVIASGTPAELKTMVGGDRIEVMARTGGDLDRVAAVVAAATAVGPARDEAGLRVSAPVDEGAAALVAVVRELDRAGIEPADIGLRRPTLDDVFLRLTGRTAEPALTTKGAT
jgi:ABC-2 type transport system ATP-binding protein